MRDDAEGLAITFDQSDAAVQLRRLRANRWNLPREKWAIVLAQVALFLTPIAMNFSGILATELMVAFLAGYLVNNVFEDLLKAPLERKFLPPEFQRPTDAGKTDLILNSDGLHLRNKTSEAFIAWSRIAVVRRSHGITLRLGREQSVPIPMSWMPEGWDMGRLDRSIGDWKA